LEALIDDDHRAVFEGALNSTLLRIYDLQPECVHLDSIAASGHWKVSEDGQLLSAILQNWVLREWH